MRPTSAHTTPFVPFNPNRWPGSQTPVVEGFRFSAPGFRISNGQVFIEVDHSSEIAVATQAQRRVEWVLRRAHPADRESILEAISNGPSIGLDVPALRDVLRLTPQQMTVLRAGYAARPLRQLIAQQPFPKTSKRDVWRNVAKALQQEVFDHRGCLSIDDVWSLAHSAAAEMKRRGIEDALKHVGSLVETVTSDSAMHGCFDARTQYTDPWLNGEMGGVEAGTADRLYKASPADEALPPLLIAQARWLDNRLELGLGAVAPPMDPQILALQIKDAFEQLLGQSFALGEHGPQDLHQAYMCYVFLALDNLGATHVPAVGTPSQEQVDQALLTVGQPQPSRKRDAGQIALSAAPDVPVQEPTPRGRREPAWSGPGDKAASVAPEQSLLPTTPVEASSLPPPSEEPSVVASQQVLLLAFKQYDYTLAQGVMAQLANKETVSEVVEYLLGLNRPQWTSLFTIANHLKPKNEEASQLVATLFLMGGDALRILHLLPTAIPPALRRYAAHIDMNLDRWRNKTRVEEIKKKLGLHA